MFSEDSKDFSQMLQYYMNIRNEDRITVYKRVKIDRRQFSKYYNGDRTPSRKDAIKLCIGLRLTVPESFDLLSRAGFAFNPSDFIELEILRDIKKGKSYQEIDQSIKQKGFRYF